MQRSDLDAAPAWVIDLLKSGRSSKRIAPSKEPLVELDRPEAVAKAIDWLKTAAPEAVEGDAGDHTTFRVAARLRDMGLSRGTAFEVLAEHWNEAGKASPPWPADDLMQKVDNAFAYATGAWGGALGVAEFEDTTSPQEGEVAPAPRPRLYRVPYREAADSAIERMAEPLIDGVFDQETFAVVYGPSNSGKTFLMLDLAFHVAAGRSWLGHDVAKGLVVYVAAEGGRGIFKRIAALRRHYGVEDAALEIVPCPINLLNSQADVAGLIALVREAEAERGEPARMVVIDTASRALAGGDENASTDMGAFVKNVDRVRQAVKATLCVVHHSGKDLAKGARGWSGLRAATDTEIEIVDNKIRTSKQRDIEALPDLSFKLEKVEIGKDGKGRLVTSCVLHVTTGNEFVKVELGGRDQAFFEAFQDAAREKAANNGNPDKWRETPVEWHEWVEAYRGAKEAENESAHRVHTGFSRTSLQKMRASVCESGHVRKTEDGQYVSA